LLDLQNTVLEMIAKGEPLADTAARLCIEVEKLLPEVICSVIAVDRTGLLHPLAGPSLPSSYSAAIEGLPIGPCVGSCGSAIFLKAPISTVSIEEDPRWTSYKHLVLPLGLKACWSSPIFDNRGEPIGAFAFYYRTSRGPTEEEQAVVRHCVHLCAIALERHERVTEQERRAVTDALTSLPNRAAFNAELDRLDCSRSGAWALFLIDIDNLKVINDTFSHQAGDCLLRHVASELSLSAAPDQAYRIGGDEFAIILRSREVLHDLTSAAGQLLDRIARPADCGGHIVVPRATIGSAVYTENDRTASRVRQNADFALYHAKETGRGGFVQYWPGIGTRITRRLDAIRDIDAALREGRIEAFYQPIVRLDTREIVGLEALARMRDGNRYITASEFCEATKDAHIAAALTERMVGAVATDVAAWLQMGIPFQHVGINMSSADVHGGFILETITKAFEQKGVPMSHVILEVTESVYMDNDGGAAAKAVAMLRGKGLKVALDDFGTGFASLTHLLTMPVDIIKIDRSFVARINSHEASFAVIEGLISIARRLGIRVVAEGIETEEQAASLQELGCLLGQGYLFAPAVKRDQMTTMLKRMAQPPTLAASSRL
jgi:diguanylate cyclase (GGDEF)-like protein